MKRTALAILGAAVLLATPGHGSEEQIPLQDSVAAAPVAAPATPETEPAAATGRVERATFATGIADREPVDSVVTLPNTADRVFFFTELHDLEGQTVTHRWEHRGEVVAEVSFHVGSSRWRVYSSKNLLPGWTGEWTVSVVDETGHQLEEKQLSFEALATAAREAEPEPLQPPASPADTEPGDPIDGLRDSMGEEMWRP